MPVRGMIFDVMVMEKVLAFMGADPAALAVAVADIGRHQESLLVTPIPRKISQLDNTLL